MQLFACLHVVYGPARHSHHGPEGPFNMSEKKKNNKKINKAISLVNKGFIIIVFCCKIN